MSNVVTATFNNCTFATVTPLYAYDYGQILKIDGVELPASFEVHFCNEGNATTTTQIGSNGEVTIPDAYLETGKNILAYIYLHTGEDDGETEYKIKIPVRKRPQPTHETPTPVQQSEIEQALAALNSAVEEAEDYAEAAEAAAASVHNVPAGGSTNQVLAKNSNDDYDLKWVNQSGGGGGTSDYTELTNKPQIEGVTLSGNKTASDLGLAKTTDIPSVPVQSVNSKTGEVVLSASDVGAYVKPNDGIPKTDLASAVQTSLGKADSALQSAPVTSVNSKTGAVTLSASDVGAGTYSKPSGGIPASDLASAVQTSLGKADTALQSYTETDPTVPSWAKASSKPSYNASEVGAIAAPVSPSSGDFLVYNGSAWAAQAGSGGGGETPLELIASGTLSEDAARIYIDEDSNGNAFALDEIVLGVYNKASTSNTVEGYGKVFFNVAANSGVYGDERVVNSAGFYRKSGQQSTIFLRVKLIKCGAKYQFMTTFLTKNDTANLGTDTNFVARLSAPRSMTETNIAYTSCIENGITSILVATDVASVFGPDSSYILFGRRIST